MRFMHRSIDVKKKINDKTDMPERRTTGCKTAGCNTKQKITSRHHWYKKTGFLH